MTAVETPGRVLPPAGGLAAAHELLLILARGTIGTDLAGRAAEVVREGVAWEPFLAEVRRQGVHPLVERNLERLALPCFPSGTFDELRAMSRAEAVRSGLIARELAGVLRDLAAARIPVIPLKGPALAASLYGDPTLRVSGDIDILVPLDRAAAAFEVLAARGYRCEVPDGLLRRLALRWRIEAAMERVEGRVRFPLELHWGVLWGGAAEREAVADLFREARPSAVLGSPALELAPAGRLLFLAAHAARHRWEGLRWLVDLHEAVLAGGFDGEEAAAKARRFGWDEVLALGLGACRALFGTELPPGLPQLEPPPWVRLYPRDLLPRPLASELDHLPLLRGKRAKMRSILRMAFVPTPAERRLAPLPEPFAPLYWAMRPLRLAVRFGWRLAAGALRKASGFGCSRASRTRTNEERSRKRI